MKHFSGKSFKAKNLSNIDKTATHIEGKSKVGIKTGKEHEEGSDEVVDGCSPRVGRDGNADDVDERNDGATQVLNIAHVKFLLLQIQEK